MRNAENSQRQHIHNSAGTELCLHYIPAKIEQHDQPVILSHGTFSNYRSCKGLADYLTKNGFNCWILDFQGHGFSEKPNHIPDFESMVLDDTISAIHYISNIYPSKKIHWIGHSGGGLAILMTLARYAEFRDKIASITTLASQATDAGLTKSNRLKIHLGKIITHLFQFTPGKILALGPENEYARVMQQWFKWNLGGQWLGVDGFDYLSELNKIDTPLLVFSGEDDTFIAPQSGCIKLYDQVASSDKLYYHGSIKNGFKEDYNHSRIIASRSALRDIWPKIEQWLSTH